MAAFKFSLPGLALGSRRAPEFWRVPRGSAPAPRLEALPPILALEGEPDPSLRHVIDQLAERLGAAVCSIDGPASLANDPDLDAVVAVVLTRPRSPLELRNTVRNARLLLGGRPIVLLAPQPLTTSFGGIMPIDPSLIAPPITVERLLFALDLAPATRA